MADQNQNQELDLDQLDKAVSALMDQATKKKSPSPAKPADTKAADPVLPASAPAPAQPQDDEDDDGAVKVNVKRPMPQINRSRGTHGRAMDVISPPKPEPKPALHVPKREAPTLQPTGPITVEPPKPVVKEPAPLSAPDTQAVAEPSDDILASIDMKEDKPQPAEQHTLTHHKSDMPDPLDVHGFNDEPIKKSAEEPVTEELEKPAEEPEQPAEESQPKPDAEESEEAESPIEPGTPFVKADVEKRPLGAYANETTEDKTPEAPAEDKLETDLDLPKEAGSSKREDVPNPSMIPPQTPKELSPEVVAVESSEPEHIPTDMTDMQQLGQMSIPQQYQAEDKTANTASRPVFDTKDYHPPIEAHARSHRGFGGIIWLIVFILILGGVLAVAYFVITGSIDLNLLFG